MTRPLLPIVALLLFCTGLLHAETRTLTDQFGRTITADIIALEGDTLKIRRDDGIVFGLPIANLSIEDQKSIREWAARQPKKVEPEFEPDPKLLPIGISRVKLSSTTVTQFEGYRHSHEMWGYGIQLTNKHLRTLEKLRVEYNLFARTYSDISSPQCITGSKSFDSLRANDSENMRTKGTEVCKRKDVYFGNTGGEMRGIWVKVYYGDKLVHDFSSPESLKESESWTKVARN